MHIHVNALSAVITFLEMLAMFGVMRLWALAHPGNRIAQGILTLY